MLTFEKVLKVFQAYLEDDPLYEVVQTMILCQEKVQIKNDFFPSCQHT